MLRTMKCSLVVCSLVVAYGTAARAATYTAASCNQSDVDAVINGPTHTAVNGDTISIPAGSCTWTSGISVPSGVGITLRGAGTPNSSPSQMGAATAQTIITDERPSGDTTALITMSPDMSSSTSRLSMLEFAPSDTSGSTKYHFIFSADARCSTSSCPSMRIDNVTLAGPYPNAMDGFFYLNNLFGVADHNTLGDANHSGWIFLNLQNAEYLGVGKYGDNSWAQPDSFGTNNAFYVENNLAYNYSLVDTGVYDGGGARWVGRFNQVTVTSIGIPGLGTPDIGGGHGTETGGRTLRGVRQKELYGNTYTCNYSSNCFVFTGFRSATARMFGNTITGTSHTSYEAQLVAQRRWRSTSSKGANSFGMCDGSGPFDTNDGVVYYQGTIGSVTPINGGSFPYADFTLTDSGNPNWSSGKWAASAEGGVYSFHDVTGDENDQGEAGPWGTELGSNTANTLTTIWNGNAKDTPAAGDTYQILRATVCLDQPARGAGRLIQNNSSGDPVLASTGAAGPADEALDPIYILDEHVLTSFSGNCAANTANYVIAYDGDSCGKDGLFQKNRDFYIPNAGQGAQTSPTSPFNGSTAGGKPGVGWGPLSDRPSTCTSGVAYLATDQGTWNKSGNGFGQGELYICKNNAWPSSPSYTPYVYPHPLVSGVAPSAGGSGGAGGGTSGSAGNNAGGSAGSSFATGGSAGSSFATGGSAGAAAAASNSNDNGSCGCRAAGSDETPSNVAWELLAMGCALAAIGRRSRFKLARASQ